MKQIIRNIKLFLKVTLQFHKCEYCGKRIVSDTMTRENIKGKWRYFHFHWNDINKGTCWQRWKWSRVNEGDK